MKRITKRSSIVAVTAAATVLVTGGVAFAYWTSSGSGTASAAVASTPGNLTVAQSGTITGLFPGGTAQNVNVIVTNPTSTTIVFSDVLVAVTGTSDPACTVDNFAVADNAAYSGGTLAAGANTGAVVPKTVRMVESGVNQDVCKGVSVNLSLTVS